MTSFEQGDFLMMEETKTYERQALLQSRELFYNPATIEDTPLFCTDERPSDEGDYLQACGGVLSLVYNFRVMNEVIEPGSTDTTFAEDTAAITPVIAEVAHAIPGVHSSEEAEGGKIIKEDCPEDADCGYAKKRSAISGLIAEQGEDIIAQARELRPELFTSEQGSEFARQVIAAHGRLSGNSQYFTTGRDVVVAGMHAGARTMVVRGQHTGREAILNLVPDTTLNTNQAANAGLPTYGHNAWATAEIANRIRRFYPYDLQQMAIAELIDTIGTWRALGVETMAARRPQAD